MVTRGKIEIVAKYSYFAGILDGEGCISIHRATKSYSRSVNPKYQVGICVVNTDFKLIEWLLDNIGGTYSKRTNKNPLKHKDTYSWKIGAVAFKDELKEIAKYLVNKKEQALIAIDLIENVIPSPKGFACKTCVEELKRREELYQKMLKANKSNHPQRLNEGELITYD